MSGKIAWNTHFCGVFHVQTFIDHRRQFSLFHLGRIRTDTVA
jgi:hypothetical protein